MRQGGEIRDEGRAAAEALYREGAIAALPGETAAMLVGDLRWRDAGGVLLFAAYGDGPGDARLVCFDQTVQDDANSVSFVHEGHVAATLRRIETAAVDDPEDYRIAWQLWQQVAPLRSGVIDRCYATLEQRFHP